MRTKPFYALVTLITLASCGIDTRETNSTGQAVTASDTFAAALGDTTIAIERKIIKTADLKCRVDNVLDATQKVEGMVKAMGGTVEESRLENRRASSEEIAYKPDSVKLLQTFEPVSYLSLRVPDESLDSVVNSLSAISGFVDVRNLKQQDATIQYLGNKMKNYLAKTQEKAKSGKVADASYNNIKGEEVIYRELENLQLVDKVNYSTLTVALYQAAYTQIEIKPNPDNIRAVPYSTQLYGALDKGWYLLKMIMLAIVFIWPLWIAGIIIVMLYRYRNRLVKARL